MRNLTLMTDFYELTMMYGYFRKGMMNNVAVFDAFYRPKDNISYAVAAGLEDVVRYINGLHFTGGDIAYLRAQNQFD